MITGEDMYNFEQEKKLEEIRGHLENALEAMNTAFYYLQETGEYESHVLDNIADNLSTDIALMKGILS